MQQHRPARRRCHFAVNAAHLGARQCGAGTMQGVTLPLLPCSSDHPSGTIFWNSTKLSMHVTDLLSDLLCWSQESTETVLIFFCFLFSPIFLSISPFSACDHQPIALCMPCVALLEQKQIGLGDFKLKSYLMAVMEVWTEALHETPFRIFSVPC